MPHRLALQSARFAQACEVEVRVGKIRIGVERCAIAVDRVLRLPKVLLQDRQVEEQCRIGPALVERVAVDRLGVGELAALMQEPSEVDVSVEMGCIRLDRAAIRVSGFCRLLGFDCERALEPLRIGRRFDRSGGTENGETPAGRRHLEPEHVLAVVRPPLRIALADDHRIANRLDAQSGHRNLFRKLCAQPAKRTKNRRGRNSRVGKPLRRAQ